MIYSQQDVFDAWDECRDVKRKALVSTYGIPYAAINGDPKPDHGFALKAASVLFYDGCRFEMASLARDPEGACEAIIVPCRDEFGDLADLCAWDPINHRVGLWLGRVTMLGEHHVTRTRLGLPLPVYESPCAWLQAYRDGVCILDAKRAAPLLNFVADGLLAETPEAGLRLNDRLTIHAPRIVVDARKVGGRAA